MNRKGIAFLEILVVIAILGILATILLPAACKARESSRRSNCVNNLKQFGLVLNMYANENADKFLPIDNVTNNFMFEGDLLYPEYLSDTTILACPSDPETDPNANFRLIEDHQTDWAIQGEVHPDCITDMSYSYVGWMLIEDKETEAFFDKYDAMSQEDRDRDMIVPEGSGNAEGDTIHRLSAGVDRFLITDINVCLPSDECGSSLVPVIWDQISTDTFEFSHVPAGQNVLYLDGHVDFHRYDTSSTHFPISPLTAAKVDERPRDPILHCDLPEALLNEEANN
jgi:prepilin-type N-terminal cleavage/methylation domain-containing protein/prepilin-type processing-associated H-X9-DG protein